MILKNRKHAGELLAAKLLKYKDKKPFILALPRGGVPVAAEIAKQLRAPLDVLIVRKIGAPFNAELAVGAICENDEPIFNALTLSQSGVGPDDIADTIKSEKKEVERQIKLFRNGNKIGDLSKNMVIIVDDGLATGATVKAAIKYLNKKGVEQIVVAVPVAPSSTVWAIRSKVEELATLVELEDLYSVGQWYKDFSQVEDDEVISLLQQNRPGKTNMKSKSVEIKIKNGKLNGELTFSSDQKALVIFTHGSGSSRKSTRNLQVANTLNEAGFGTLLFDLLTEQEENDRKNVFDIDLLSNRLLTVTKWLRQQPDFKKTTLGYFGASTGAAAALVAASKLSPDESVYSIVSRGGRPDLAGAALNSVEIPTLLIVGGHDYEVLELNREAQQQLSNSELKIVPKATHLFEEAGALDEVSREAVQWFNSCLKKTKSLPVERPSAESYV